jgi:hypothetical protein
MIRAFFSALGVLFAALLIFCASFLGRLGTEMRQQEPAYRKLAVDITRELSRTWRVQSIKAHYTSTLAARLDDRAAQAPFDALRPLGPLRYADDVTLATGWSLAEAANVNSPAAAAEFAARLLRKSVRVSFLAKFANGFANVTLELRNEGGRMKLWHLQIDSHEPLPHKQRAPRKISHA